MKVLQHYSKIDPTKCIGCHLCKRRCPGRAITVGRADGNDAKSVEASCTKACPTHINVAGYVGLIGEQRFAEAYSLIMQDNPFPSICGRICTHPCEEECNRGFADKPIAIRDLKKFVADEAYQNGESKVTPLPKNGKSVGIVGAGPSGMTCAYYLALLGYEVHVYEEESVAGGVLAYGIPEYRLPKAILKKELDNIVEAGVTMHLNCSVGKDVTMEQLRERHDALYMATGTKFSKKMDIPGEDLDGVMHGLDFLHEVNLGKQVLVGKNVVVIGGGNTAMDVARTLIRLGVEQVTILYRRGLIDMHAERIEIQEAMEEGVKFVAMTAPAKVLGNGKVERIECLKTQYVKADDFGRRNVEVVQGSEHFIACDMIIPAVSQYFDLPFVKENVFETTKQGNFITDEDTMMTSVDGVFAGGDMIRGSDVAVTAIADGKKAAIHVDLYLGGSGILHVGDKIDLPEAQQEETLFKHERFPIEYLPLDERKATFSEAILGYTAENAVSEAGRCLHCNTQYKASVDADLCLDCGLCVEFCPQDAPQMILRETPRKLQVEVRPECMEAIAELCKKAHQYPSRSGACPCNGISNAELAQAILDGAHTPVEIAHATGAGTGCGGVYCNGHIQQLLAAAGYPIEDSGDHLFMHNGLDMWEISKEVSDSHAIYNVEFDKDHYFKPELFEDYRNVFPKALQEKLQQYDNEKGE